LKRSGAKKIILDLRENPGGLLNEAVNVVNIFVPKGEEVVATKGKVKEWNKTYFTLDNAVDKEIPLVVLTSTGSASASEIVAGALQDYDRAVLVGKKTFGKGLVQTTKPLSYNSQLKITTAKYYIPSGRCIQELDYAHRMEDGTVSKIADSLRAAFKTRSGRKVFDGGGLDPDVPVKDKFLGTVTVALLNKGLIFDYATKYSNENPMPKSFRTFRLDDNQYNRFVNWVGDQKFSYITPLENSASDLYGAAKEERNFKALEKQLDALKGTILANKTNDLIRFKSEVKQVLEQEIAFHYGVHQGSTEYTLDKDDFILEASRILNDQDRYKKILTPTTP
jgi:carboxyl-terminal processing protease